MASKSEVKSIEEARERIKSVIKSEKITNKPIHIKIDSKKTK